MKKTLAYILGAMMILGLISWGAAFVAEEAPLYTYGQYDMAYLPGTTDTVTNMPENETGLTPGADSPYTVSSTVPVREGFEFIDWELAWGTMDAPAVHTLSYHVVGDDAYGTPADSVTPETVEDIPDGGSVDPLALVPTTSWTSSDGTADGVPGAWSFSEYWTEDEAAPDKADLTDNRIEGITEDKNVYGKWNFTPDTYEVTYVVNPDPTYGAPEDSVTPTDENNPYAYKAQVTVKDDLTTTQDYAVVDGKQIPGTWTFTPWDKEDFQITEDTIITGAWTFTVKRTDYTVMYLEVVTDKILAPEKKITDMEIGAQVTETAIDIEGYIALDPTEATLVLAESGNVIIFYYQKQPALTNYVVKYLYVDTLEPVLPDKIVSGVEVGAEITETAVEVDGFTALAPTEQTFTVKDGENVIIFYYDLLDDY